MSKIKRLFFDIETSPNIGLFWSAGYKKTISPDNIIKERAIICICYKWEGKPKVYSLQWDKNKCDKAMIKSFLKVLNQASFPEYNLNSNGDMYPDTQNNYFGWFI